MKISKVDHKKTAVGKKETDGKRGIMYTDPSKTQKADDVSKVVKQRTEDVQKKIEDDYKEKEEKRKKKEESQKNSGRNNRRTNKKSISKPMACVNTKERQERIVKSIKNQDVKVQVFEKDNEKMLMLSNYQHPKKHYIADFAIKFAECKTEKEEEELILHMRRLIVMFVFGPEEYDRLSMEDPWKNIEFSQRNSRARFEEQNKYLFRRDSIPHRDFNKKIKEVIKLHYRAAKENIEKKHTPLEPEANIFWLGYFSSVVERFAKVRGKRKPEYYKCVRMCDTIWKEWVSFMAMKYVDIGKAVYYFATPNLYNLSAEEPIKIGPVLEQYEDGLTSFDYEKVKAEESLTRNLATSVVFAENAFANAAVKKEHRQKGKNGNLADVLSYDQKDFENGKVVYDNVEKRIMWYFGGATDWRKIKDVKKESWVADFLKEIKNHISNVRNTNFHFSTDRSTLHPEDNKFARVLFRKEFEGVKRLIGEKYVSNNTIFFYPEKDDGLYALIEKLYSKRVEREAQVPAFNTILKRKDIQTFANEFLFKGNSELRKKFDNNQVFLSSLYFLLKEIYYYAFLGEKDLLDRFDTVLEQIENENENKEAYESFVNRYEDINTNEKSFGQLCQQFMTDYNMQNQGNKEILSSAQKVKNEKKGKKTSYEHYKMILQKCIRKMFENYLNEEKEFAFLKNPRDGMNVSEEKAEHFINNIPDIQPFDSLSVMLKKLDQEGESDKEGKSDKAGKDVQLMYDWYITAHFLSAKQINLLIGDIRNYKQYVAKISERASGAGYEDVRARITDDRIKRYEDILLVLEFVQQFVGRISKNIEDYFDSTEEYAKFLSNFIDFDEYWSSSSLPEESKYSTGLHMFCNEKVEGSKSTDESLGIYHDGKNPIVNKNIIYSLLYGDSDMLSEVMKKGGFRVSMKEIQDYYRLNNKLEGVFVKGKFDTKKEAEDYRAYQNRKNRIELLDIQIFTELVNDMMAQMVSWAYLRERDLLFFHLGYHYTKLFYTDRVTESLYRELKGNKINIEEGALLYQFIALYDHVLSLFYKNEDGKMCEQIGTPGPCINKFVNNYCINNEGEAIYNGGIRFFENKNRHTDFSNLRNYFAHMKYYSLHDKSIWDLLGEIYNGFLQYDTKLKKSVSFISKNILERYFVVATTTMKHKWIKKTEEEKKNGDSDNDYKERFTFSGKLESDEFTYKIGEKNKNSCKVKCRSDEFIAELEAILNYAKEKNKEEKK